MRIDDLLNKAQETQPSAATLGRESGFNDLGAFNTPGVTPRTPGTYRESRQRYLDKQGGMPPSWDTWFPQLSPQDQEVIKQKLQQGMSPEEVEARLRAKGIL